MKLTATFVGPLLLLLACGGRVEDDGLSDGGTDSSSDVAVDSGMDAETGDRCAYPNGSPICSGDCPQPEGCPYCWNFSDGAGTTIPYGFCLDLESSGKSHMLGAVCGACRNPTELCGVSKTDDLHCVDASFCEKAGRDGYKVPCRWQDTTPWSPGQTIPEVACPSSSLGLCGGSCGTSCPKNSNCVGRSPTHPVGICAPLVASDGRSSTCERATGCGADACMVYKVDAASQRYADVQGVCVPIDRCKGIRAVLPGGVFCAGKGGVEL